MKNTFGTISVRQGWISLILMFSLSVASSLYAEDKSTNQLKSQVEQSLGEDPGPVYTQVVLQWAKVTNFAQNAAEVIVGKFKLDMEHDPKMRQVLTPALIADLEQFFYELFLSPETIRDLARVYAQYFTLDDMQDLIKFYQSPVGQKFIKADAQLKLKTQQIGEALLKRHEKEYMLIIAKYIAPDKFPKKAEDKTPEASPENAPEVKKGN
jgi:hypothetical protein